MTQPDSDTIPLHCEPATTRMRFYEGQLLLAPALAQEQAYLLEKMRQTNRALFEPGVIKGLALSVEGGRLHLEAGFAMDRAGRLLELGTGLIFEPPAGEGAWCLCARIEERAVPMDLPNYREAEVSNEASLVEERVQILLRPGATEASPSDGEVMIARIRRRDGALGIEDES